jgi:hypothetical protein
MKPGIRPHIKIRHQRLILAIAVILTTANARAQIITETYTFPVGGVAGIISDDGIPARFSETISSSQIGILTEVRATLSLQGTTAGAGWASDMFASLNRNGAQTSILLNQVGVDGSNPGGYGYDGWNVSFRDNASNRDIHFGLPSGSNTILTGEWQPDGRQDPYSSARSSAMLNVFNLSSANATWNLVLADLNPVGQMTLASWSLTFTGVTAVPEPSTWTAITASGLCAFAAFRARTKR